MKVQNWCPKKNSCLCSQHFTEDCFIRHESRTQLKKGSVPTIFRGFVSVLEIKKEEEYDVVLTEHVGIQDSYLNSEICIKSDPSSSCNVELHETSTKKRSYKEICKSINHDHQYESSLQSSKKAIQRMQKALKDSQAHVKTLSQHVKRLQNSVTSLKSKLKKINEGLVTV